MGEIIRTWLRTRLGVMIDLRPEIFGHYSRDGTLLAKILHSYDIINDSQLNTINRTQDPALSRVNLKHLKVWLHFIGVDCDAECIDDISKGKGIAALRLFYKVFLCLENKDRLHFITLQKEREKYIPTSTKFDVTTVREDEETQEPRDHPLAGPLKKSASLVEWHRKKYEKLNESYRKDKGKVPATQERMEIRKISPRNEKNSLPTRRQKSIIEEAEKRELDEFERKHKAKEFQLSTDPCENIFEVTCEDAKPPQVDFEAAKAYTTSLKNKHRDESATKNLKSRMQKILLSNFWEKVANDQEMEFDEIVARKVLNQSQYEKQIMRKLCDVRSQKTRMAENRQIVEELVQKTRETQLRLEQERTREILVREAEEVEAERRRMSELERRINEEIERKKEEKLREIGEGIVNDLIDISVKAGEYKVTSGENTVPTLLWSEWKALFLKNQPIFETVNRNDKLYSPSDFIDEFKEEEIGEEMDEIDRIRTGVLKDNDFENYHYMQSPWNDFVPNIDDQVREFLNLGIIVLGYVVHKLLEGLHPCSPDPGETALAKMKTRAVVLGIPKSLLSSPIQELLADSKIHLVCMGDAINHCLEQYKMEMKDFDYIDLSIIAATKETLNKPAANFEEEREKNEDKNDKISTSSVGKIASSVQRISELRSENDKLTQTPRKIPYEDMDPTLSDTAYIGKWTHEFLTLGQPLSDELNAKIIAEYLKSLKDVEGFLLVNYPNTYKQMTCLEFALSGRKLPDSRNNFSIEREDSNIEEIDPVPSRISFESEASNSSTSWRESRLVPNPIKRLEISDGKSYLTAFVRMKLKSKEFQQQDDKDCDVLSNDPTSLDAFYIDQGIAKVFYYTILDLSILKKLVRFVITGEHTSATKISSGEIFGEVLENLMGPEDDISVIKAPTVMKSFSRPSDSSLGESISSESTKRSEETEKEPSVVSSKSKDTPARPGQPEWPWTNFSHSPQLIKALSTLWKNLETCYIENLRDILYLKRRHFSAIIPYADFVMRHMKEFINRPDKKQDLLYEFHRAFNVVDVDIRENMEVKQELQCRVADFETQLWEICDLRRREAEEEKKRFISEHWTTRESMILTNTYIGIIQAEIDRCTDTLQLVQNYYMSIVQRPFREMLQPRILLQKIPLKSQTSESDQDIISIGKVSSQNTKAKDSKETKIRVSSLKNLPSPSPPDKNIFREEIAKLLADVDQENFTPSQTICYKTVETNIMYVRSVVETMETSILEILKKEEKNASKTSIDFKHKKGSLRKVSQSSKVQNSVTSLRKQAQDLVLEWRYAIMFEINRIRVRLKMLEAAAMSDINFLVENMQRLFFKIHKRLVDRYKREVKSVNEMASMFRVAIEEAKPIQEEISLDGDRFLVRPNVLMFPDKKKPRLSSVQEKILPSGFQMDQLGRLMDVFRRVSPSGILSEQSFVYILQDLIACGDEEREMSPLPSSWLELRSCDVSKIVTELFGDEEFVDWREFIIYAMDIDMPSVEQILQVLEIFKQIDKKSKDVISCVEFSSVGLWFFDSMNINAESSGFMIDENIEASGENLMREEKDVNSKDPMRLAMAKELLCEMFLSKPETVNYTAFLMAFCKDEEPKKGLGKALSLAVGNKICMDWEEGEKYIKEANKNYLREEATETTRAVLSDVLKKVIRKSDTEVSTVIEIADITKADLENSQPQPIHTENLHASEESSNPADSFPVGDEIPVLPSSENVQRTELAEEIKIYVPSVTSILPEKSETNKREYVTVYWLSLDVCQSVLAAMLPSHATQPDLFGSGKSLRENLELVVYSDLKNEELNDEPNVILAHRFLDHSFVNKLLADTSKFTTKHLGNVLDKTLRDNK